MPTAAHSFEFKKTLLLFLASILLALGFIACKQTQPKPEVAIGLQNVDLDPGAHDSIFFYAVVGEDTIGLDSFSTAGELPDLLILPDDIPESFLFHARAEKNSAFTKSWTAPVANHQFQSEFTIYVTPPPVFPAKFTLVPDEIVELEEGNPLNLQVKAEGSGPLEYSWWFGEQQTIGESLAIPAVALDDSGLYRVLVSNVHGSDSAFVQLQVLRKMVPIVLAPIQDETKMVGSHLTIAPVVSGPNLLQFQWFKGETPISSDSLLQFPSLAVENAGFYQLEVRSEGAPAPVRSNSFEITVKELPPSSPARLTQKPDAVVVIPVGGNLLLEANAVGSAPLSYQWIFGSKTFEGEFVRIPEVSLEDAGEYHLLVSNPFGADSAKVQVEVEKQVVPIQIAVIEEQKGVKGSDLAVIPSVTGPPSLRYRWLRGDQEVGADSALRFSPLRLEDAGSYQLEVTSEESPDPVKSNAFQVVVSDNTVPLTLPENLPAQTEVVAGKQLTLSVKVSGTNPMYQWYFSKNKEGPGEKVGDGKSLFTKTIGLSEAGYYWVEVSNSVTPALSSIRSQVKVLAAAFTVTLIQEGSGQGKIVPAPQGGKIVVPRDSSQIFEFQAEANSVLGHVDVNGVPNEDAKKQGSFSVSKADKEYTIRVRFDKQKHRLQFRPNDTKFGEIISQQKSGESYEHGTLFSLVAKPADGYEFRNWEGISGEAGATLTNLSLDRPYNLVAHFSAPDQFSVAVTVDSGNQVIKTPDLTTYTANQQVKLTPVPAPGFRFVAWSDSKYGDGPELQFPVTDHVSLIARFERKGSSLQLTAKPQMGGKPKALGEVRFGSPVTVQANVADGFEFVKWVPQSGNVDVTKETEIQTTVVVAGESGALEAQYRLRKVEVKVAEVGGGKVSPGSGRFDYGSDVTITLSPEPGWTLQKVLVNQTDRTAAVNSKGQIVLKTIKTPQNLIATFTRLIYPLTLENATGGESVTGAGSIVHGDPAVISATAKASHTFKGWEVKAGSGNFLEPLKTGSANTSIRISGPVTLRATYQLRQVQVSVSQEGEGKVTPASGNVGYGSDHTLSFAPNPGWKLHKVTVNNLDRTGAVDAQNRLKLENIRSLQTVQATFRQLEYPLTLENSTGGESVAGEGSVVHGAPRTIRATPKSTHQFEKWVVVSGEKNLVAPWDSQKSDPSIRIVGPVTLRATYKAGAVALTFHFDKQHGTVKFRGEEVTSKTPVSALFGSSGTISIQPKAGFAVSLFDLNGSDKTAQVKNSNQYSIPSLSGNQVITIQFSSKQYDVTVRSANSDVGSVSPAATVPVIHGATLPLTATIKDNNFRFGGWNATVGGSNVSFKNSSSLQTEATITGPATIFGNFVAKEASGTVSFEPGGKVFNDNFTVTLTGKGTIHYTTNGNTPTLSSTPYSNPIPVNKTMTIKAMAVEPGKTPGPVRSEEYRKNDKPVAAPNLSASTTFEKSVTVTIRGEDADGSLEYFETRNLQKGSVSPSKGAFESESKQISFQPSNGVSGEGSFEYRVRDEQGAFSQWATFKVQIGENQPPKITTTIPNRIDIELRTHWTMEFSATDPENHTLNWELKGEPPGMTFKPSGSGNKNCRLSVVTDWNTVQLGKTFNATLTVTDSKGAKYPQSLQFFVTPHQFKVAQSTSAMPTNLTLWDNLYAIDSSTIYFHKEEEKGYHVSSNGGQVFRFEDLGVWRETYVFFGGNYAVAYENNIEEYTASFHQITPYDLLEYDILGGAGGFWSDPIVAINRFGTAVEALSSGYIVFQSTAGWIKEWYDNLDYNNDYEYFDEFDVLARRDGSFVVVMDIKKVYVLDKHGVKTLEETALNIDVGDGPTIVDCANPDLVCISSSGKIERYTISSQRWDRITLPINEKQVVFYDQNTSWALHENGKVYFTQDGWATSEATNLSGISYILISEDGNHFIAYGNGKFYR